MAYSNKLHAITLLRELFRQGRYEACLALAQILRKEEYRIPPALLESITCISNHRISLARGGTFHHQAPFQPFIAAPSINLEEPDRDQANPNNVAVIIPIYKSIKASTECLASVYANTGREIQVIVIDDFSNTAEANTLLELAQKSYRFDVYQNERNIGFSATINKGLEIAGRKDVIILNSDTIVPPGWLKGLHLKAYLSCKTATVTAISNSAGPFSVDISRMPIIEGIKPVELTQALLNNPYLSGTVVQTPALPTGHGFCMYIKRCAIDRIGGFDSEAFPKGYGEENDFCMRAIDAGFEHSFDNRTFVYHAGSSSFGSQKQDLVKAGRSVIDNRYPHYKQEITSCFNSPAFKEAMGWAQDIINSKSYGVNNLFKAVLYIASTKTGGTPQTNLDLMKRVRSKHQLQPFCLYCREDLMELSYIDEKLEEIFIWSYKLKTPVRLPSHTSKEYDYIFLRIMEHYRFDMVHIRHIAWHSIGLFDICSSAGVPIVFSLHDFYTVCPNIKLLDAENTFCGGYCTSLKTDCTTELWPIYPGQLKHEGVLEWRTIMSQCIVKSNALVTTSATARSLIHDIFGKSLAGRPFRIIEHGRERIQSDDYIGNKVKDSSKLKVIAPGNITVAKGGQLIKMISEDPDLSFLEIHIVGRVSPPLGFKKSSRLILHGKYDRGDLPSIISSIDPDLGVILSIWPETYCHTLSELWMANIPVIGCDIGALGERIKKNGIGWAISASPQALKSNLIYLKANPNEIIKHKKLLQDLNRKDFPGHVRDVDQMTRDYVHLYQDAGLHVLQSSE